MFHFIKILWLHPCYQLWVWWSHCWNVALQPNWDTICSLSALTEIDGVFPFALLKSSTFANAKFATTKWSKLMFLKFLIRLWFWRSVAAKSSTLLKETARPEYQMQKATEAAKLCYLCTTTLESKRGGQLLFNSQISPCWENISGKSQKDVLSFVLPCFFKCASLSPHYKAIEQHVINKT